MPWLPERYYFLCDNWQDLFFIIFLFCCCWCPTITTLGARSVRWDREYVCYVLYVLAKANPWELFGISDDSSFALKKKIIWLTWIRKKEKDEKENFSIRFLKKFWKKKSHWLVLYFSYFYFIFLLIMSQEFSENGSVLFSTTHSRCRRRR